jgi:hypothetical protein
LRMKCFLFQARATKSRKNLSIIFLKSHGEQKEFEYNFLKCIDIWTL